jgi:hypothetical protein
VRNAINKNIFLSMQEITDKSINIKIKVSLSERELYKRKLG